MATARTDSFAHGTYADDSGVVFYGPPVNGFWEDRLAVSDRFIHPLFSVLLDRAGQGAPKVVTEWNEMKGWTGEPGIRELSPADATALAAALEEISPSDIAQYVAGVTADECLRCAAAIRAFIGERVGRGAAVFVEDD